MTKELLIEQGEFDQPTMEDERQRIISELENRLNQNTGVEYQRRQFNRLAIQKAERTYGKLSDVEDFHPENKYSMMKDLYMYGLVCLGCGTGHKINFAVYKFCNFEESVKCMDCQHK